ncbi:tetratricopeptide repeat protein [Fontivita pretiosa]|jgi:tetratricopeptide (TPR) repeat protein|uniref:tetratricopeptide repeat protein n=1 Tax=Fontivita pretiosa TaxID=2989684 RepID=UPI003D1752A4
MEPTTQTAESPFLDVPAMLEQSLPRPAPLRLWQVLGVFLLVVMLSTYLSSRGGQLAATVSALSALTMMGLLAGLVALSMTMVRRARAEQAQLVAIEELVRLRRWPEAADMLQQMLTRPTRTPQGRAQALIFLTAVLARYNRFEDAIAVQNYLLETTPLDGGTAHGLRLARVMAMLREDHLFDADRAINELRRQVTRAGRARNEAAAELAGTEPQEPQDPQTLSAGLALIEIYRDVKTGHPAEAIELFNQTLPTLREQFGHRVADAWALVARAYDMLGRDVEAAAAYEKATLLQPAAELHRRYPETATLADKYRAATAPGPLQGGAA